MSAVQGYLAKRKRLDFEPPEQPWFRGCPSQAAGGFPGQGWRAARACVGGGTGGNSRLSWPGGWSSLFAPSWGAWRCCSALQQACSCCCLPSLFAFSRCHLSGSSLFLHQTKPSFIFIFSPDFSAEKYPFCALLGSRNWVCVEL